MQGQENPNTPYQYDKRAKHEQLAENTVVSVCKIEGYYSIKNVDFCNIIC